MKIVLDTNSLIQSVYVVTNDHHFDILRQTSFPHVDVIALADFAEMLKRMH